MDRFATAVAISKRANANLCIKISKHTISRRVNEINLKWADWNLPLNTLYRLKNSGVVFISAMSQSLTCSVVTEGSFDAVLRNDIHLSALKTALNLEEEVLWCLAWFQLLVQNFLVKLTQLYTKRYWRNMHLIWELQLINQLYLCKITPRVTQRSLLRYFFLRRMSLLWSGQLKAQTWILLRMFGSYLMEDLRKRIQET